MNRLSRGEKFKFFWVTFLVNFAWEISQGTAGIFAPHGDFITALSRCAVASLGDVLIVLSIVMFMVIMTGTKMWFLHMHIRSVLLLVVISLLAGVLVEWWGISTNRWAYTSLMPLVPYLGVGIIPVLQMPILVPLIAFIMKKTHV